MISARLNTHTSIKVAPKFLCRHLIVSLTVWLAAFSSAYGQEGIQQNHTRSKGEAVAVEGSSEPGNSASDRGLQRYKQSIEPLLKTACFDCHSGDDVEGNFRADQLDPDLVGGKDTAWWLEVYAVLSKGEMPPPESKELTDDQRTRIVDWLSTEIQAAEKIRKASGNHSSFRRLTRYEYNYALQDLLGVPWTFASELPAEASEDDAFENNTESLHMSAKQVETYRQLALNALRRVTVRGDQPPAVHWAVPMQSAFQREKRRLDRSIESAKEKFDDKPEKLAKEVDRLNKEFQTPANRSHYLELSSGLRAEVDWSYRKASYAFRPVDAYQPMPEPGTLFAVVQPGSRQALTVELGDALPDKGMMRVRIRASRAKETSGITLPRAEGADAVAAGEGKVPGTTNTKGAEHRVPSLQLHFGFQATDQGRSIKRLSQQDVQIQAQFGRPEIFEWNVPLSEIEHRNTYRGEFKLGQQPSPSEYIRFTNSTVTQGSAGAENAAILIDYVEVSAPVYDQWPPSSHRSVFIASEHSNDETAYAREVIADFLTRAWRRSPSDSDIDRKVRLFQRLRPSSDSFHEAIIEVLAAILASPKFLYVLPGEQDAQRVQIQSRLSQNEIATRLALFLWCSLPDETLLQLAAEGRLRDQEVLRQQVDRMLADRRAARFSKHFVVQWLKMQPLDYLVPTRGDDGLDESLLDSMKQEPIQLFADMLRQDSSVLDLIDSNYAVVNERLAAHYGIPGIHGNQFRRVTLPAEVNRGGLLTQAGLLAMNSDGKDSHPVKRGVWLLTSLLNDPPPPPPPAVPEIDLSDPEIAKLTLKERIEDHRNHAACLSCHQKIDPWGIAFENYDAIGRWRDKINDKAVDATSLLPSKQKLDGMKGLKEHLVQERREQFMRATLEKMASFALGRQLAFGDREKAAEIAQRVQQSGDGVKTMVTCLVTSELFQSK